MIVVWENVGGKPEHAAIANDMENLLSAIPLKSLYSPHNDCGVVAAEFTADNKYLISLGNVNPFDPFEFLTFNSDSVYFYAFDKELSGLHQFEPSISAKDFKTPPVGFTSAIFSPIAGQAVLGTAGGDIVLFADYSLSNLSAKLETGRKCAIKNLSVHNSSVTFITSANKKFFISGDESGMVKFRILFWHELKGGPIQAVMPNISSEAMFEELQIPELIVATAHAKVYLLSKPNSVPFRPTTATTTFSVPQTTNYSIAHLGKESHDMSAPSVGGSINPDVNVLLEGQYGNLQALIIHPDQSKFAIAGDNGVLQIWDYNSKQLVVSRHFFEEPPAPLKKKEKKQPEALLPVGIESLCYSKSGKTLAVGFANGIIRFLDANNLIDLTQTVANKVTNGGYKVSTVAIKKISFSVDGNYCALADANFVTAILHKETIKIKPDSGKKRPESPLKMDAKDDEIKRARQRVEWVFVGRRKAHYKEIIALLFTTKNDEQVLYSVSKDRHITEYNLRMSTHSNGIEIKNIRRIEQIYYPEAATLYHNHSLPHPEEFILTFNSGFKFKLYSKDTQLCRSTTLGPTFGGLINSIQLIPHLGETKYFVYSTGNILGLAKFPLDGNPFKFIGVIAHPFDISNIAVASNGSCVVSAGGKDGIVNLWTMNYLAMESQIAQGGEGMEPFLNMLDPSGLADQGHVYREFEDFFYLAQIKTQGEDTTLDRIIGNRVPLTQIPSLVQAMGYYPSNQETDDMTNEVKYNTFAQANGQEATDISLHDLIRLYLNHRPEVPISAEEIEVALSHGKRLELGKPKPIGPVPKIKSNEMLKSEGLFALVQQFGNPN
ncbi:Cilia- and flagella-associated protein 251 [Terramyces sp. JEL0728]|nr:Cilia- and flagella-associated protein 251 [Terramyces sp. JEL0728]